MEFINSPTEHHLDYIDRRYMLENSSLKSWHERLNDLATLERNLQKNHFDIMLEVGARIEPMASYITSELFSSDKLISYGSYRVCLVLFPLVNGTHESDTSVHQLCISIMENILSRIRYPADHMNISDISLGYCIKLFARACESTNIAAWDIMVRVLSMCNICMANVENPKWKISHIQCDTSVLLRKYLKLSGDKIACNDLFIFLEQTYLWMDEVMGLEALDYSVCKNMVALMIVFLDCYQPGWVNDECIERNSQILYKIWEYCAITHSSDADELLQEELQSVKGKLLSCYLQLLGIIVSSENIVIKEKTFTMMFGLIDNVINQDHPELAELNQAEDDLLVWNLKKALDIRQALDKRADVSALMCRFPNLPILFDPEYQFNSFLKVIGFDENTIIDYLLSEETVILEYLVSYFHHVIDNDKATKQDCEAVECIGRLQNALQRFSAKGLFPYNISPLCRLVELFFEKPVAQI